MALKSELGEDGFDVWNDWSQGAQQYNSGDVKTTWRSIKVEGGVNIGSLFHLASQNGWRHDGALRQSQSNKISRNHSSAFQKTNTETARLATALWAAGTPAAADHAYLISKRLAPCDTLREIEVCAAVGLMGYVPKRDGRRLSGRLLLGRGLN